MCVHGYPQGYAVLMGRLQRAEQEGETGGGLDCTADLGVRVPVNPVSAMRK